MQILLATHNLAKLERYGKILKSIPGLEVVSLADLKITEKADENYNTNMENALHKARTYGKISGLTTIAVDESLMTNFLPDNQQPGVYARRFAKDKKELTDEALIEVWKEIFKLYPQENKQFIFDSALAYYNPGNNNEGVECVDVRYHIAKYISDISSNGYPLDRLMSSTQSGLPYIEMNEKEKDENDLKAFAGFVEKFEKFLCAG